MTARVEQLWPLFPVREMRASLQFYCESLDFEVVGSAESEGSVYWCRIERGGACLMLQQVGPDSGIIRSSDEFYFVCDDADLLYEELRGKGLELEPPSVAYYGMKQLFVPEPDGRAIVFESRTEDWVG